MGHRRKVEDKRRLKKLYDETKTSCCSGAYYSDRKGRIIKFSPSDSSQLPRFIRKISNKKVRKAKEPLNYGSYKKVFDYWWTLF